jgi:hypothetical protein
MKTASSNIFEISRTGRSLKIQITAQHCYRLSMILFSSCGGAFSKFFFFWVGWLVGLFVVVMVLFNCPQCKVNTYTMNLPKIRNYVACLWSSYIVYKGENLGRDKVWCYWEHIEEYIESVIGNN